MANIPTRLRDYPPTEGKKSRCMHCMCASVCAVQAIPGVNYASMLTRRQIAALGTETFLSFQSAKEGIRLLRYHEIWYDPRLCWGSWISQVWGCKGRAQGDSREVRQYRVPTKLHTKIFAHQLCCQPPTKPGVCFKWLAMDLLRSDSAVEHAASRISCYQLHFLHYIISVNLQRHRGHPATVFTSIFFSLNLSRHCTLNSRTSI